MIQKYHATTTAPPGDQQLYIEVPKHLLQEIGWDGTSEITASLVYDSDTGVYQLTPVNMSQLEQERNRYDPSNEKRRLQRAL